MKSMGWHDIFEVRFSFSKNLIMTILFNRDTAKRGVFPAKLQVEGAFLQKNFLLKLMNTVRDISSVIAEELRWYLRLYTIQCCAHLNK